MNVIITGSTGMVGEGVLLECLNDERIQSILLINRKSAGYSHAKIKEIICTNFHDLVSIQNNLGGYEACFFCSGPSSIGMKKEEYYKNTYELTMNFARTLLKHNPQMIFCYVSGAGTNIVGIAHWARVKGKTEHDLHSLPFKQEYNFRPGFLEPTKGAKNTHWAYAYFLWLIPILKALFPKAGGSLRELGVAMIHVATHGYEKNILEVTDICYVAKK